MTLPNFTTKSCLQNTLPSHLLLGNNHHNAKRAGHDAWDNCNRRIPQTTITHKFRRKIYQLHLHASAMYLFASTLCVYVSTPYLYPNLSASNQYLFVSCVYLYDFKSMAFAKCLKLTHQTQGIYFEVHGCTYNSTSALQLHTFTLFQSYAPTQTRPLNVLCTPTLTNW